MAQFVDAPGPTAAPAAPTASARPQFVDAAGPQFVDAPGPGQPPGHPDTSPGQSEPQLNFAHFKSKYAQQLDDISAKLGLDPKLVRSVHYVEDASEDPNVISKAGAIGEMQLVPGTFMQFAPKGANITDPTVNIDAGAYALSHYLHKYGGNVDRALVAYNKGEAAADANEGDADYIARYNAVYKSLTKDDYGPGHPSQPLSQGGKAKPVTKAAPAPAEVPKQAQTGGYEPFSGQAAYAPGAGEIKAAPSGIMGLLESWGNKADKAIGGALADVDDASSPAEKAIIAKYQQQPIVQATMTGARLVGDVAAMDLSALSALMRDVAMGNTEATGDLGQKIMAMAKDPGHMGNFLDDITEKYGPALRSDNFWWAHQPGFNDAIANAKPSTIPGVALQAMLGLRADAGRFLLNKPFLAGGAAFTVQMLNPLGSEAALGKALVRTSGSVASKAVTKAILAPGAKIAAKIAPKTTQNIGFRAIDLGAHIEAAKNKAVAVVDAIDGPALDRYHMTKKTMGEAGEQRQRIYVRNQAEARGAAQMILGQENRLGNSSRNGRGNAPGRNDVADEHDLFYNPITTMHINQPSGGDPAPNPVSGVWKMKLGPAYDEPGNPQVSLGHVVYADHPAPNLPSESPRSETLKAGKVANHIFGNDPQRLDNFNKHMKKGLYSAAVRMAGINDAEADRFATALQGALANIPNKKAQQAFALDHVEQELLKHYLIGTGDDAINRVGPHGTDVIMAHPIEALKHDGRLIGNVPIHDRAVGTAVAIHAEQEGIRALAPEYVAGNLIDGYASRAGMFEKEKTFQQRWEEARTNTLAKLHGGGQPAPNPVGPKREYGSIRHALSDGQVKNPNFDFAAANEKQLTRMMQFRHYMTYVLDESDRVRGDGVGNGNIDYDKAVAKAMQSGKLTGIQGGIPSLGIGKKGRDAFDKWAHEQGTRDLQSGPNKLSARQINFSPDSNVEAAAAEKAAKVASKIKKAVEEQFKADHPNLTFRTDEELGVPDLRGRTVPTVVRDAAIDGHPVLNAIGPPTGNWASQDAPHQPFQDAMESLNNMMRSVFMANVLYHPFWNLSRLAFGLGYLNPLEIAQGLLAPHTISDSLVREAHEWGARSQHFRPGPAGAKLNARYAYSEPTPPTGIKGIMAERLQPGNWSRRVHTALEGFKNVAADSGPNPLNVTMHVLGKALYNADRYNIDWTFGVFEDGLAALTYGKLRDRGIAAGMKPDEARAAAANQVRKIMGDTGNITPAERALGLQRMNWFYGWTKGQYRLWSRVLTDPRTAKFYAAQTYGTRAYNEATPMDDPQNHDKDITWGYDGDRPMKITVGGGFLDKASGIADLAAAPITGGQGLLDFGDTVVKGQLNTLNPMMRLLFIQMPATFGEGNYGAEPGYNGPIMDRALSPEQQLQQAMSTIGGAFIPSEVAGMKKMVQDRNPAYLMELIGPHVTDINEAKEAKALLSRGKQSEKELRYNLYQASKIARPDQRQSEAIRRAQDQLKTIEDLRRSLTGN